MRSRSCPHYLERHMPPLLKPYECSLLVLDNAGTSDSRDSTAVVVASWNRILQAAALCEIPVFIAHRVEAHESSFSPKSPLQQVHSPPMPGNPWGETPLGLALARAGRMSLLICGYWLDECVTFTSLYALGEGYDVYLATDASPPLENSEQHVAISRLVQAGIVPTTTRQVIREWAREI